MGTNALIFVTIFGALTTATWVAMFAWLDCKLRQQIDNGNDEP